MRNQLGATTPDRQCFNQLERGLHLEGAPAEAEALALAASALGRSLVATDVVLATPLGAPAWEAAYRRAMEAANEARAAAKAGRTA